MDRCSNRDAFSLEQHKTSPQARLAAIVFPPIANAYGHCLRGSSHLMCFKEQIACESCCCKLYIYQELQCECAGPTAVCRCSKKESRHKHRTHSTDRATSRQRRFWALCAEQKTECRYYGVEAAKKKKKVDAMLRREIQVYAHGRQPGHCFKADSGPSICCVRAGVVLA